MINLESLFASCSLHFKQKHNGILKTFLFLAIVVQSKNSLLYRKIENQKVGGAPHVLVDHHHQDHEDVADPPDQDDDAEDDRDQDGNNRLQSPENLLLFKEGIRGDVMRPDLITDVVHVSPYFCQALFTG